MANDRVSEETSASTRAAVNLLEDGKSRSEKKTKQIGRFCQREKEQIPTRADRN